MKTLFKSQELWDLVENGYEEPEGNQPGESSAQLRENRKKDSKALLFIQMAMDDEIFPRISGATTSKEAWEILKQEYLGDKKSVQEFSSRVSNLVNHMKSLGDNISSEIGVSKVLRSLDSKFDRVVAAIEESRDLSTYKFDELMSSLMAHEDRMNRSNEKAEEKTFSVKGESWRNSENFSGEANRGRGGYRGRGRGRFGDEQRQSNDVYRCDYCNKTGHKEAFCWQKQKDEQNQANFVEDEQEESHLFLTHSSIDDSVTGVWYIYSGCSNHMTGTKSLFRELDEFHDR
ncbi:uncharacterized protein LOC141629425 [Silene latifolia]|uniref:uncharacterized protein LOC141629425 n=1 Tax=Silene latifolia TaxID=37657 RepID=UPI003D76A659